MTTAKDTTPAGALAGEYDDGSFPASDAPGWITETTIGPPARRPAIGAAPASATAADRPANPDARRVVVVESSCHACSVHTVHVHHRDFPEMQIEDITAGDAAQHLASRLEAARAAADPMQREAARRAIGDVRAFLDREGPSHIGRDIRQHPVKS